MDWEFEWITDWDTIWGQQFQAKWSQWIDESENAHVFYHPEIVKAWVETYMPLRKIEPLFCVASLGNTVVFFPLIIWKMNWKNAFCKKIIPAGYSDFDYHDPLFIRSESSNFETFWNRLFIELENFKNIKGSDSIEIGGIRDFPKKSPFLFFKDDICPLLSLEEFNQKSDLFLPSLKSSLRGDIKRQIRRLEEQGDVELVVYESQNEKEAIIQLNELLKIHTIRWPNAYKAPNFHQNILTNGLGSNTVHFSVLFLSGLPISWHLGFLFNERMYYYMPAIALEYQKNSPGKIHLYYLNKLAIESGCKFFDHLRGEENYKDGWTTDTIQLYKTVVFSNTFFSRCKQIALNLKNR